MLNFDEITIVSELACRATRAAGAQKLAKLLGVEGLIIFIREPALEVYLPAPGFPQTLPAGRLWTESLEACGSKGLACAELPSPFDRKPAAVTLMAAADGSILALLGGRPRLREAEAVLALFPVLAVTLRNERITIAAEGHLATAREAAMKSQALALTLDEMRATLQKALHERDEALQTMREADRRKDEFLAVLSHELRTPLNIIGGHAELLRLEEPGSDDFWESLDAIDRNTKAQTQLVSDLLDVSRIITGKFKLDVRPFDVREVVASALDSVRFAADAKGVHLAINVADGLDTFIGDPDRLQQVFWNLLTNAVRFTPKGGLVKFTAIRDKSVVSFKVEDTGLGIGAEFLPHVFDRFHQEDASSTRRYGGLGLGLAIVRHIAELHGGFALAESAGKDQGSVFTVALPMRCFGELERYELSVGDVAPARNSNGQQRTIDRAQRTLAGLTILVIDDQADARKLLHRSLGRLGAAVSVADSGMSALAMLKDLAPDVIICDVGMPTMNGHQFMRQWRVIEREQGRRPIPAMALTAYASERDRSEALAGSFQSYLAKPVRIEDVVKTILMLSRQGPAQAIAN